MSKCGLSGGRHSLGICGDRKFTPGRRWDHYPSPFDCADELVITWKRGR